MLPPAPVMSTRRPRRNLARAVQSNSTASRPSKSLMSTGRIWEAVTISVEANCRYVPKAVVAAVVADDALCVELSHHWPGLEPTLEAMRSAVRSGALRDDLPAEVLVEHAGAVFLQLLARWARSEIDQRALTAGVLHAYDICLLAVAGPSTRSRLLEHMSVINTSRPPLRGT